MWDYFDKSAWSECNDRFLPGSKKATLLHLHTTARGVELSG
jgi:hypothetical protein